MTAGDVRYGGTGLLRHTSRLVARRGRVRSAWIIDGLLEGTIAPASAATTVMYVRPA